KQDCPANRGGEGPVHEKGKLLLYQWLKKHNVDVRLEHYLPNIQQQPDLFLQLNKQRIAIEYQCSKIPITQLQKRNKGYQNAGITPIWILGPNQFKRDRSNRLHVNSFILQCMHQLNNLDDLLIKQILHPQQLERKQLFQHWTKSNRNFQLLQQKRSH